MHASDSPPHEAVPDDVQFHPAEVPLVPQADRVGLIREPVDHPVNPAAHGRRTQAGQPGDLVKIAARVQVHLQQDPVLAVEQIRPQVQQVHPLAPLLRRRAPGRPAHDLCPVRLPFLQNLPRADPFHSPNSFRSVIYCQTTIYPLSGFYLPTTRGQVFCSFFLQLFFWANLTSRDQRIYGDSRRRFFCGIAPRAPPVRGAPASHVSPCLFLPLFNHQSSIINHPSEGRRPRGPSTLGPCCTNRAGILCQTEAQNPRKSRPGKE